MLGAADIVVKPITGASTEGFEGFMKGIGRGAISVLVKPTLGAVDLAKYTMEAIRRYDILNGKITFTFIGFFTLFLASVSVISFHYYSSVDDELAVETSRLPRLVHCDKVSLGSLLTCTLGLSLILLLML